MAQDFHFLPGAILHDAVMGAFKARGASFEVWCAENGVHSSAGLQEGIASAVDGAASYEELLEKLPEALRHMPTGLAVETLVKGMFNARALGDQKDG